MWILFVYGFRSTDPKNTNFFSFELSKMAGEHQIKNMFNEMVVEHDPEPVEAPLQ